MAPSKKSSDTKEVAPVSVAVPVVPTVPVVPVPEVKKVPVKAKAVKNQSEPVAAVETKEKEVVVTEGTEDKEAPSDNVIQVLTEKLTSLTTLNKEIQVALKQVVKSYDKLQKIVDKIQKKRDNARKSPSGFAKPNKISDELCDFIGVDHGTEKSRTDITRYINSYVKEHNLNKPTNRRIILPDDKLRAILNVKDNEEVTFFILQRLISHHFPSKAVPKVVTPA
jgi:chromatin remodeling complex protein RSC6